MPRPSRRDLLKTAGAAGGLVLAPALRAAGGPTTSDSPRAIVSLDRGWRFALGHAADPAKDFGFGTGHDTYGKSGDVGTPVAEAKFDDSGWHAVDLPHDWAVDLPFERFGAPDSEADRSGAFQGFKPLGRMWPATSVGWYRRAIPITAEDAGKRLSLEFDGVARNCLVIFNGFVVGSNESGYAPFRIDITDFAKPGEENLLVLRCDVSLGEAWSYEGAGLYRHVRLVKTAPTHIRQWGATVRCEVRTDGAIIRIETEIDNDGPAATARLRSRVTGPDGRIVAELLSDPLALPDWGRTSVAQEARLSDPALWSLDTPQLYALASEIIIADVAVDRTVSRFGIRTIRFDPDHGFFLNGLPVKIKGTCNHQDHAGVGFAVPDSLHVWRLERLKAMGANAYRSTHHSPSPAILDACDAMGILVMDETRQMSSNPEAMSQLDRIVRQGRNHPSIILWSLGNEEIHRGTPTGARIAATMKRRIYELDGTRPVTEAFNGKFGEGASPVLDVMGCNYYLDAIDPYHVAHPTMPMIGTETGSTVMTRGEYKRDDAAGIVPAYDTDFPKWATTAETWWSFYDARPFLAGGFVWTGFDYRGEPTPFERWPENASNFGQMDSCGFPKDNYHYYRAWWGSRPALHLFPHWNWPGREGQEIAIWVHSNCDAVELFLNGRSLGRQSVTRNRHLAWQVPYIPGRIEAHGFARGRHILTEVRETTGTPQRIGLTSDRHSLAPGEVAVVRAAILDAKRREVPTASNRMTFTLDGDAKLLGVGNGDPRCLEPDHASVRSAFNGLCMAIVQTGERGGAIRLVATGDGLDAAMLPLLATRA
ncbi:MAG: beta-galactosidase GalA [Pseudomonadota bacterium]|uniref:Beta-galactosidase GalA n=1 Tax=Sphingomonas echinoides TaxID=59803 RepID=A0ABU4PM02_9SPHN|nr:beta-galactosidase GalA [Sphingomonas echinoides]MDX5985205.1 beta-galactosidase GalA [Sphingomonas echinoides]